MALLFNWDIYFRKMWNIFRNAPLNSKLLAVHQLEKLLMNSKLRTLRKNLTRVHLWGTFASHCGSRGILWAVNQNKCGHLIGRRYRHTLAMRCKLNGNTVLAIFLLFKKATATSMFNNSPALYRNICSTYVQILGDLSLWTPKLCFY